MQMFLETCLFLLAVFLCAYVPGKLLLLFLKLKLRRLEDLTLACSLGLVLSCLAYWLIAFFQLAHFFFLWPLATTAAYLWLHRSRWKLLLRRSSKLTPLHGAAIARDKSVFVLCFVIALGVTLLALLPQYYTNFTLRPDGSMRVHAVYDVFFHIAVANELTHAIPPQAPVFAGQPLNYHYGMDLAAAMFARATGIHVLDLTLRFMPTLFLALSMLSVFCFARTWLKSGYFGSLVVFLVFFGEDFSFIPGMLLREKADWSVRFFLVPSVLSLFYTNAMLPAVGLLFAGLFCLQKYLRQHGGSCLCLSALLFVALMEVKLFTALHIMFCLGVGAILYLLLFRTVDLLKVAVLTAVLTMPLVLSVFLHNKDAADFVTAFSPWPYVSTAMSALGVKGWASTCLGFTLLALPIYLIGCFGLRILGVPNLFKALVLPARDSGLRFILALFVIVGIAITLMFRIVPASSLDAYNNSVWFLAQSKYVAWIFAVEVVQFCYQRLIAAKVQSAFAAGGITVITIALSVPSTMQHFALECDPNRIYGLAVTADRQSYSQEMLGVTNYMKINARPGDVVLPEADLLGPVLALTKCRVPLGYFASYLVSERTFAKRQSDESNFWAAWRLGNVQQDFLRMVNIRYILVAKTQGIPAERHPELVNVFENSEYLVYRVVDIR